MPQSLPGTLIGVLHSGLINAEQKTREQHPVVMEAMHLVVEIHVILVHMQVTKNAHTAQKETKVSCRFSELSRAQENVPIVPQCMQRCANSWSTKLLPLPKPHTRCTHSRKKPTYQNSGEPL